MVTAMTQARRFQTLVYPAFAGLLCVFASASCVLDEDAPDEELDFRAFHMRELECFGPGTTQGPVYAAVNDDGDPFRKRFLKAACWQSTLDPSEVPGQVSNQTLLQYEAVVKMPPTTPPPVCPSSIHLDIVTPSPCMLPDGSTGTLDTYQCCVIEQAVVNGVCTETSRSCTVTGHGSSCY